MVLWVFGYGSLIWKAGFNYDQRIPGFIKGYRRVFYQGMPSSSSLSFFFFLFFFFSFFKKKRKINGVLMGLGSTDHRGTPEYPGRTVTLEPALDEICWGVAYKISKEEDIDIAITYLEVREKQYDQKVYLDLYTESTDSTPAVPGVLVYVASSDKKLNNNYLGPASLEDIAKQIVRAEGPSGPNRDYLFQLEKALLDLGCKDAHVLDLAREVRRILSE